MDHSRTEPGVRRAERRPQHRPYLSTHPAPAGAPTRSDELPATLSQDRRGRHAPTVAGSIRRPRPRPSLDLPAFAVPRSRRARRKRRTRVRALPGHLRPLLESGRGPRPRPSTLKCGGGPSWRHPEHQQRGRRREQRSGPECINHLLKLSTLEMGNLIGVAADGVASLGNGQNGILFRDQSSQNLIGGTSNGCANKINFNGRNGITLAASAGTGK